MMLGTVRPVPAAFTGPFQPGKVGCGADVYLRPDGMVFARALWRVLLRRPLVDGCPSPRPSPPMGERR